MTFTSRLAIVFALLLPACSSSSSTPEPDGAVFTDVVSTDRGAGNDTSVTDVRSTTDAATTDVVISTDVVTAADVPAVTDVSVSTDAATCHPSGGGMAATTECDQVQLAILSNGSGAPRVTISGRVNVGLGTTGICVAVDSISVVNLGVTLATFTGTGVDVPPDGNTYLLAMGTAPSALAAWCSSDSNRFDGLGLVMTGHMDGGTFTSTCGNNTGDSAWPPRVVVTCHSGIQTAPILLSSASVMAGPGFNTDQIMGLVPQPPVLVSVDSTVHINPGQFLAMGGPPLSPMDTPMWMGTVSSMMVSDGSSVSEISLFNGVDILGSSLCPTSCASPPCMGMAVPPVFLARVTGTTAAGTYSTELYVPRCLNEP